MGILQDPTQENFDEMIRRLQGLQDAPHPDVACIANTVLGLIHPHEQEYLSALAQVAIGISAKMLPKMKSRLVLCGNTIGHEDAPS